MNTKNVMVVRVYVMESTQLLNKIVDYLQNEAKISGVSVFRAISGFGETGNHTSSFIDLSLNLPLIVEFFDSKEKTSSAISHLSTIVKHEHIIFWEAQTNN